MTSGQVVHGRRMHRRRRRRERERAEQPDRKTVLAVASGWTYYTAGPAKPISQLGPFLLFGKRPAGRVRRWNDDDDGSM